MRATNTFQALCLGALLGLTGCVSVYHDPADYGYDDGPPAYGPSYRHYGVEHVYDVSLGVYTVVGYPDTYWDGGSYWRHSNGYWESCARPHGGHWSRADWGHVPQRLRPHYGDYHGGGHDGWDRRGERAEQRHDRRFERTEARNDRRDEHWQQRNERGEQRHDRREARADARHEQKAERNADRHVLGDGRHDHRDEGWQRRNERKEQRNERRDEHSELRHDQRRAQNVERHERKSERRDERRDRREEQHDRRLPQEARNGTAWEHGNE